MNPVLNHGVPSGTRNEIETVTESANEKENETGTETGIVTASVVSAANEIVNENGTATATAKENESVVEETRKEHAVAADGKSANALVNTNGNVAVEATLAQLVIETTPVMNHPEKSYDEVVTAMKTADGSAANETKEQRTWHQAAATNMKAVYGLHRLWVHHLRRLLRLHLSLEVPRMSDDGAVVVSANVTGTVREIETIIATAAQRAAAVVAAAADIASVDEGEMMEDMVKVVVVGECGWATRARGLDVGCKHMS